MLLLIRGDLPGRRDAGLIWAREYTAFLVGEAGFRRSIVDRSLYWLRGPSGRAAIFAGVHVDDCASAVRDPELGDAFNRKWCERFGGTTSEVACNG